MALKKLALAAAGLTLVIASGCTSRADIEEIKKNQKDILAKLDAPGRGAGARPPAARPNRPDPNKIYSFDIGDANVKGDNDAWVTIVEVSDFQCPFCKRVGPTLKQVEEKYGKDVRIAFKHNPLPFHKRAKPAAMAAECAGEQGKFWAMHDALFEGQRSLEDADLEGYAAKSGANVAKWKTCVSSDKFAKRIDQNQKQAAQLGARGTPAFFINGRFLSGAQPFASFEKVIDEELKKAKSSGVSKSDYYKKNVVEKGAKRI